MYSSHSLQICQRKLSHTHAKNKNENLVAKGILFNKFFFFVLNVYFIYFVFLMPGAFSYIQILITDFRRSRCIYTREYKIVILLLVIVIRVLLLHHKGTYHQLCLLIKKKGTRNLRAELILKYRRKHLHYLIPGIF